MSVTDHQEFSDPKPTTAHHEKFVFFRTVNSPSQKIHLAGHEFEAKNHVLKLHHGSVELAELEKLIASGKRPDITSAFVRMPSMAEAEAIAKAHLLKNPPRPAAVSGSTGSDTGPGRGLPPTVHQVDISTAAKSSEQLETPPNPANPGQASGDNIVRTENTEPLPNVDPSAATKTNFAARLHNSTLGAKV